MAALNIPGLIAMIGFYAAVLATGIWASKKAKAKKTTGTITEVALLGERSINLVVGIFTMTASWVVGGCILAIAEAVYSPNKGLIWPQMPLQFSVAYIVGGLFFANPMRDKKYVTVIDPFEIRYGKTMAVLIFIPALIGELLNATLSLAALGGIMSIVLDLQYGYSVVISAVTVTVIYALLGGFFSVAYTDIIQLIFSFIGLASDKELQWVIRISVVVTGVFGTALSFIDSSIVFFWILSADMAYCVILPQMICVLFSDISNVYGAVVGFVFSILLRFLSGEPLLGLPPVICYPGGEVIDGVYIQPVSVRTITALVAFFCILFFSYTIACLFHWVALPKRWDVFGVTKVIVSTSYSHDGVLFPGEPVACK